MKTKFLFEPSPACQQAGNQLEALLIINTSVAHQKDRKNTLK